jgi:hypothetical protein
MRPAKVGNYTYFRSTRKDKKLMTQVNGKLVHFGQMGYKHYFDILIRQASFPRSKITLMKNVDRVTYPEPRQ